MFGFWNLVWVIPLALLAGAALASFFPLRRPKTPPYVGFDVDPAGYYGYAEPRADTGVSLEFHELARDVSESAVEYPDVSGGGVPYPPRDPYDYGGPEWRGDGCAGRPFVPPKDPR